MSDRLDEDSAVAVEAAIARLASAQRNLDRLENDDDMASGVWSAAFEKAVIANVEPIHLIFETDRSALPAITPRADPEDLALALSFIAHVAAFSLKAAARFNPALADAVEREVRRCALRNAER